jgi:hypothetical protein
MSILNDRKGAVLVVSVFFAAFLVGALWYVIAIGDAILARQTLQDGADAVAFGSAVHHARGMNLLALLNLATAGVTMLLVVFKSAQILLALANLASCAAGGSLNHVCNATSATKQPFAQTTGQVEGVVDGMLRAINAQATAVATTMPILGEAKAGSFAAAYRPSVEGGVAIGTASIPGVVERSEGGLVASDKRATAGLGASPSVKNGTTLRLGLPVSEDPFTVPCERAAREAARFVFRPFDFVGGGVVKSGVEAYAGAAVSRVLGLVPSLVCGGGDIGGRFAEAVGAHAVARAQGALEAQCRKRAEEAKAAAEERKIPIPVPFDEAACNEAARRSLGILATGPSPIASPQGKSSKGIYAPAALGDDYFAIWSFVHRAEARRNPERGVAIAAWRKGSARPSPSSEIGLAKAEFHYEPRPGGPTRWSAGLADESMWNMRWRARLVRTRMPVGVASALLAARALTRGAPSVVTDLLTAPKGTFGPIDPALVGLSSGPITH